MRTITIGTYISVQGELVKELANGRLIVRVGTRLFEGRPVKTA